MICRGMRLLLIILTLKRPLEEKFGYIREHLSLWISQLEDVLQEVLRNGIETCMIFSNLPWYHCKLWHWLTLMMPVLSLPIMNKQNYRKWLSALGHNNEIHCFSSHIKSNYSLWPRGHYSAKAKYKTHSNRVALYNFQGNKVASLLPWTTVVLRNTMAIANRIYHICIARTKSRDHQTIYFI